MALICPNCDRRYQGDEVYCEECGDALIPARASWRKPAIIGGAVLLFAAAIWSALEFVENDLKSNVSLVFGPNPPHFDSDKKEVDVPVTIRNNSMFDFKLDSVKCQARILGLGATCSQAGLPKTIAKDRADSFTLQVELALSDPTQASSVTVAHADMQVLGVSVGQDFDPPNTVTLDSTKIRDALLPPVPVVVALPSEPQKTEKKQPPPPKPDSGSKGFTKDNTFTIDK